MKKYIGIDLGGTNVAAGLVDEEGNILLKKSIPTPVKEGSHAIVKAMADVCYMLLEDKGLKPENIEFCGIAAPGCINCGEGIVEKAANLGLISYPVVDEFIKLIPFKNVRIDNDANAAAKGEAEVGQAKGYRDSIMVTLGTGVGGGIIIDGKVYAGFNYSGAELGHMVIEHNGRACTCGRKGCWETYSSATGLIKTTVEKMQKNKDSIMWTMCKGDISKVSGRTAFDAMRSGDAVGKAAVDEYIDYLACGIVNLINMFAPNVISIGGGISNEGDSLLIPLCEAIEKEQFVNGIDIEKTKIVIAKLKNDAGIIGAAMLGK